MGRSWYIRVQPAGYNTTPPSVEHIGVKMPPTFSQNDRWSVQVSGGIEQRAAELLDLIHQKGQHHQGTNTSLRRSLPRPKLMGRTGTPGSFRGVERARLYTSNPGPLGTHAMKPRNPNFPSGGTREGRGEPPGKKAPKGALPPPWGKNTPPKNSDKKKGTLRKIPGGGPPGGKKESPL